ILNSAICFPCTSTTLPEPEMMSAISHAFSSCSMAYFASPDLSQMALSWASAPAPTIDPNPRRCHSKGFPPKILPRSLPSLPRPLPSLPRPPTQDAPPFPIRRPCHAHPPGDALRRPATRFCPPPPASPRSTRQPQPADSLHDGRE